VNYAHWNSPIQKDNGAGQCGGVLLIGHPIVHRHHGVESGLGGEVKQLAILK
jgi:hypothetical protein